MLKLVVIADDLTGSNDAGVQFAKYGLRVQVLLGTLPEGQKRGETDVLVLDTDSRASTAEQAGNKVRAASRTVKKIAGAPPLIFKKIDSTLRGNLGPEIDAAMDEFGFEWAAVVPAFPANGRITVGGWHLLHQTPIAESEIARDPKTPVHESVLPELLASQSGHPVGHVYLSEICRGPEAVKEKISSLRAAGIKVISFDASTEKHLLTTAQAIAAADGSALWVGCAGLAEMIPPVLGWARQERQQGDQPAPGPVLVVAGSVSNVTNKQMQCLLAQDNVRLVSLQADSLLENEKEELQRCYREAAQFLRQGEDVLLASAVDPESVERAQSAGNARKFDNQTVSGIVADALGKIVHDLLEVRPAGLFLTGGDTAVAVCRALGVGAIDILAEISPGIPLGKLSGGICPGLTVVTKAGAFGNVQAIVNAVDVLKGR